MQSQVSFFHDHPLKNKKRDFAQKRLHIKVNCKGARRGQEEWLDPKHSVRPHTEPEAPELVGSAPCTHRGGLMGETAAAREKPEEGALGSDNVGN